MSPIKRSLELQPLAREHHRLLILAQRLRFGLQGKAFAGEPASIDQLLAEASRAHAEFIVDHATTEDELLTPELVAECDVDPELLLRMRREHAEMRTLLAQAQDAKAGSKLRATALAGFADLLYDHVRWEDRELFGLLEEGLSREALGRIGRVLDERERGLSPGA